MHRLNRFTFLQWIIFLLALLFILLALLVWSAREKTEDTNTQPSTATTTEEVRAMPIEDYVRLHISELSRAAGVPEVLGGTFYVTKVEAHGGAGTVEYEDGHIAEKADFTYSVDERGFITINSFKVR